MCRSCEAQMRRLEPTDIDQLWNKIVQLNPGLGNDLAEGAWFLREVNRIADALTAPRVSRTIANVRTDGLYGETDRWTGQSAGRVSVDIPPYIGSVTA